jgi:hypothetical protein
VRHGPEEEKKKFTMGAEARAVLILAIAAAVAKVVGANIAVVASRVAALLRIVLTMGLSVFRKRLETGML